MVPTYVKKFAAYFIYALAFILLIKLGDNCFYVLQVPGSKYLDMHFLGRPLVWSYLLVYFIFLGFMLAFPGLVSTFSKSGHWYFDWLKFMAISIPILYVIITPWVPSSYWKWWPLFNYLMAWNNLLSHMCALLWGYSLASSFKKAV